MHCMCVVGYGQGKNDLLVFLPLYGACLDCNIDSVIVLFIVEDVDTDTMDRMLQTLRVLGSLILA